MVYHSQLFICLFLPLVVGVANYINNLKGRMAFLVAVSFFFYGYWEYKLLPFLIGSIAVNWLFGAVVHRKVMLYVAISFNLLILGYFKYLNFIIDSFCFIFGHSCPSYNIFLPLAISFVTFEHISYLVERYKGQAPHYSLLDYAFYIAFFPKLISGPIVRHFEILSPPIFKSFSYENLTKGYVLFIIGLIKKVFFSQQLSGISDPIFAKANSVSLSFIEAWAGVSAFSLQLYYDFSGYSDMAIGVTLMLGISLPFNFDAPYKALSLQDFWRRWHMTLSRFLRDYVYIPLGGNRKGPSRQYLATFLTMLLGGLWHGAGINFIIWGAIHGFALLINQMAIKRSWAIPSLLSRVLTLGVIMFAWVFFRSETFLQAHEVLKAMVSIQERSMVGIHLKSYLTILFAAFCSVWGPTSQEFALKNLVPLKGTAVVCGGIVFILLLVIGDGGQKEFIYFQF
ncbi:MAG: MBOAT family protein [Alphaproteobacteria bacterium]|nr:MBOAT family protein [Alphaproteobacteria bacterium]